jgi:hypothetical protein
MWILVRTDDDRSYEFALQSLRYGVMMGGLMWT